MFLDARSTDQRKLRKFFRLEKGGFLNEIACVSPPPFFSDEMVQQAREKNAISELEHDYLMEIEQTVRFRAWQAQKSSDSALISDINVDEVKAIGQKIRKSLDDQSTEA